MTFSTSDTVQHTKAHPEIDTKQLVQDQSPGSPDKDKGLPVGVHLRAVCSDTACYRSTRSGEFLLVPSGSQAVTVHSETQLTNICEETTLIPYVSSCVQQNDLNTSEPTVIIVDPNDSLSIESIYLTPSESTVTIFHDFTYRPPPPPTPPPPPPKKSLSKCIKGCLISVLHALIPCTHPMPEPVEAKEPVLEDIFKIEECKNDEDTLVHPAIRRMRARHPLLYMPVQEKDMGFCPVYYVPESYAVPEEDCESVTEIF